VRAFVKELAENAGFRHEKVSDIELAVDEVFSNAVEHGSEGSGSQIVLYCSPTDEMIRITISDTGRGKKSKTKWVDAWCNAVKERTQLGTERGHGLLLVHSLTDEMNMVSNSMGGVDVHLTVYKEGQRVEHK